MRLILAAALLTMASPAAAEVVSAGPNGFHIRHRVSLVVPTGEAWKAFTRIAQWWSKEHTYTGNAANLSLTPTPGGCFCERLPAAGGVEHMRVSFVKPGEQMVLTGGLGPLLYEATAGAMNVRFERIAGGSQVTIDYKVAGFAAGGADKLAPVVDQVLAAQVARYRTFARNKGGAN